MMKTKRRRMQRQPYGTVGYYTFWLSSQIIVGSFVLYFGCKRYVQSQSCYYSPPSVSVHFFTFHFTSFFFSEPVSHEDNSSVNCQSIEQSISSKAREHAMSKLQLRNFLSASAFLSLLLVFLSIAFRSPTLPSFLNLILSMPSYRSYVVSSSHGLCWNILPSLSALITSISIS